MILRNTIGLIAVCSSIVAQAGADTHTCLDVVANLESETVLGVVGFSGEPTPSRWLILTMTSTGTLREVALSAGKVIDERTIEPIPGQDIPDILIDFGTVRIDSNEAFRIASGLAEEKGVGFNSAHYHLRCRDAGNEPIWLLKLLGPAQDSRGVVYLSAVTGEVLRTAWTIREIEDFASASPIFTRTAR